MSVADQMSQIKELGSKRKEVEIAKINREYYKIEQQKKLDKQLEGLTLKAIESAQDPRKMIGILENSAEQIKSSVPFISSALGKNAPQVAGQITMLGAISGTGKSSNSAAIAHRNFTMKKKTLVISNEESKQNVLARVACIDRQVNFNDYIQNLVSREERKLVAQGIIEVSPYVVVADHPLATTTAEHVVALLDEADEEGGYSVAVIDFLQRINRSSDNPSLEQTHVLYRFKDLITDYSGRAKMPVIVMSQLKPMDPEEQDRQIEQRIKWCTGFYECCSTVIEAIKLNDIPVTTYHIQKSRFGGSKRHWIPHEFVNGLFVPIDKARLHNIREAHKAKQVSDRIDDLTLGKDIEDEDDKS
jgi:replicative DNA helicase